MDSLIEYIEKVLATAQAGLTFSDNRFDIERFQALRSASARLLATHSGFDVEAIRQWISLDSGYPTPKLDVRAFVLNSSDHVLLVREMVDQCWTLPGGWSDIGESPREAIEREVQEETGLECSAKRLLALFDKHKHPHPPQLPHAYKAFFLCEVKGGELLQSTSETLGAEFFPVDRLPPMSTHRVLESQIRTLWERIRAGEASTLFD